MGGGSHGPKLGHLPQRASKMATEHRTGFVVCRVSCEHDEFEDTASSSCQETEEDTEDSEAEDAATQRNQGAAAAAQPAAAADSLIPPFTFGDRPCTVPDVSEFDTWDLVDSLLALGADQC